MANLMDPLEIGGEGEGDAGEIGPGDGEAGGGAGCMFSTWPAMVR